MNRRCGPSRFRDLVAADRRVSVTRTVNLNGRMTRSRDDSARDWVGGRGRDLAIMMTRRRQPGTFPGDPGDLTWKSSIKRELACQPLNSLNFRVSGLGQS